MNQRNQQRNLRSRGRALYSERLAPKDENDEEQRVPSRIVSGTFSALDRSKYGNLYNSSEMTDSLSPPPLPVPLGREQPQNYDNLFLATFLPFLFVIAILCRCAGGSPPGEEFHRGHLIRENAEPIWAMQRGKAKRREATPEARLAMIRLGLCAMKVLRKDPITGRCQLGEKAGDITKASTILNTIIESKESSDTADTLPLDSENDSGGFESYSRSSNSSSSEFAEDDKDVYPVCLDGFEVGDTVMCSRNLSCTHAFHKECLTQWLPLMKRA